MHPASFCVSRLLRYTRQMERQKTKIKLVIFALMFVTSWLPYSSNAKAEVVHKLAIHVNKNEPKLFHEILTNVENLERHYRALNEEIVFEIVAYGGGIQMLFSETSPVEDRIEYMTLSIENIAFTACGNTLDAMEKSSGKKPMLIDGVEIVQTGITRLIQLQEEGYSYLKP